MGNYLETLRSGVPAWEVDTVEHFTVAYYFERFARATMRMMIEAGFTPTDLDLPQTQNCYVRYAKELRAGDQFHIDSGVISEDGDVWVLGHRVFNSETGELCTTMEHTLIGAPKKDLSEWRVNWDGPPRDIRPAPGEDSHWLMTGTDVLRPADMGFAGRLDLSGFIHRFSSANQHLQNMFGMTSSYQRDNRIGFSTFEFLMDFHNAAPEAGEVIETRGTVAHVGRSSLRLVHRMGSRTTQLPIVSLSIMGVHLDLDARRPKPMPDSIRNRANQLMGATRVNEQS